MTKIDEGTLARVPKAEFDRLNGHNGLAAPQRMAIFADMVRINVLYMIARAGSGHIGSSFSCADMVAWLKVAEARAGEDIVFSSKGHDVPTFYAIMAATGALPEDSLDGFRRVGGLPGHPDVNTPGMLTNTGSLGMGISKAKGMALARRSQGKTGRLFVILGDGELQEGQIWESLQPTANARLGEIIAIVDHNKIQSDFTVSSTSDLGDLEQRFAAHGWAVHRIDGHDIPALAALVAGMNPNDGVPKMIIADTIKGRGVSFMEAAAAKADSERFPFHSGALPPALYAAAVNELLDRVGGAFAAAGLGALGAQTVARLPVPPPAVAKEGETLQRVVDGHARALVALAAKHPGLVALDADLALDMGVLPLRAAMPERVLECGIAEMDMVSTAGGMAIMGQLPVCHSFACFLTTRATEHIFNNSTELTRIVYVGGLAGLIPGAPGHSHQALRDIAVMGSMPGMACVEPASEAEAEDLLRWCVETHQGPSYLRLTALPAALPVLPRHAPTPGRGTLVRPGTDAAIVTHGPLMLANALAAAEALAARGKQVAVINLPWLNRVDADWAAEALAGVKLVVSLDNHVPEGGQGPFLREAMMTAGLGATPFLHLAVPGVAVGGWVEETLAHYGLHVAGITETLGDALVRL